MPSTLAGLVSMTEFAVQAEGFGFEVGAVFQVFQGFQRQVEEVAAAAGGVEHAVGLEPLG